MKRCSKCGVEKPLDAFYTCGKRNGKVSNIRRGVCVTCWPRSRLEYQREYSARPHRIGKSRAKTLALAGFTPAMFDEVLSQQDNRCAICRCEFTGWRTPRCACADHNHTTNTPRGVLCMVCNTALGKFADSPELLRAAIAYLENPPVQSCGFDLV